MTDAVKMLLETNQPKFELTRRRDGVEVIVRGNDADEVLSRFIDLVEETDQLSGYEVHRKKVAERIGEDVRKNETRAYWAKKEAMQKYVKNKEKSTDLTKKYGREE